MKTLLFVAASALTFATAACAPTPKPDLRTALDCPANQGDLTRTNKSADGKTCSYTSSEGAEVSLQLVAVKGDAAATLQGIENAIAPPVISSAAAAGEQAAEAARDVSGAAKDAADAAKDAASSARDAAKDAAAAAREAAQDAGRSGSASVGDKDDWNAGRTDHKDGVEIRIDGKGHKIVSGDGDSAQIDLPGVHISAKDNDANVRIGGIRINANEDESTVHIIRDVRLRGEALSRTKRGIRATFIATNRAEPNGYRFVGYEAAGPKTGPLTVAVVKAKTELNHDNDLARDIKRLVRRNGGT